MNKRVSKLDRKIALLIATLPEEKPKPKPMTVFDFKINNAILILNRFEQKINQAIQNNR